jgi:hypothetical protein
VDLVSGNVKWRGEADKIGYEHVTPLTPAALEALHVARKARKSIGDGWLAPRVLRSGFDPSQGICCGTGGSGPRLSLDCRRKRGEDGTASAVSSPRNSSTRR